MDSVKLTSEYRRERISFSCIVVAAVFFLVLSQFIILKVPEVVTQLFRPAIVFFLLIKAEKEGGAGFPAKKYAICAAFYCGLVLALNNINSDEVRSAIASILFLLMFASVTGIRWNAREIKFIIASVFFASFVCAVVVMLSNPMADLSYATQNDISMFGIMVNRNKNAYAFSIGTIIGLIYLFKGRHICKWLIFLLTLPIAYCLLYSQCRGAFVCTVAAGIIVAGSSVLELRKKNSKRFLGSAFLLTVFFIAAYFLIKNSELSRLIDGDNLSGRDKGIEYAWQLFLSSDLFSKIFGHGYMFEAENTKGITVHFVYLAYIISTGIVGVGLITLMFLSTGFRIRGSVPYALYIIALLRTFFEFLDYYIYIPLILAVITYTYTANNKVKESYLFSRNIYKV